MRRRRSNQPVDYVEPRKHADLPASRRTSPVFFARRIRFPHPHAGAGGARSRAINVRISAKPTGPIWAGRLPDVRRGTAARPDDKAQLIQEGLGPELCEEFVKVKRQEWVRYHNTVTRWEIDRYLTLF